MNRILIVGDVAGDIDVLHRILTQEYEVIVAKNGQSALEKARTYIPDIILLDIVMPDISGFDVLVALKNSDITRRIPVIFITGLCGAENEEKGLLLGAVDYITKPLNYPIVKARIRTHLRIVEYIRAIERLSQIDTLTNISNRRHLDTQVLTEWGRATRVQEPVSFLMIDIDHFKIYNDTYGHPQGDVVLKTVAAIFCRTLNRPSDFVARWGGEEFAVLLPNTDLEGAMEVAERLRANIESADIPCADGTNTRITVSIGVNTETPLNGRIAEDFIARADKALYRAKSSGRNCVRHLV